MKCLYRRLLLLAVMIIIANHVQSSMIVAPHGSGRSGDLSGVNVAAPDDGSSALITNPAGVVSDAKNQALIAIQPGSLPVDYSNTSTGYNGRGSTPYAALDVWYGLGERWGWSMGVGAYGAVGAAFDLPSEPAINHDGYLGKLAQINFAVNVGKEVHPGIRVGLQLAPSYVSQKTKSPSPLGEVSFDADGFGFSYAAGVVYEPIENWSFGLMYRSKGKAELEGDGKVGAARQDVSVNFVTPQYLTTGLAWWLSKDFRLMANLRWTDYEDFEEGEFESKQFPALNGPLMSKTHNRTRWGIAFEYRILPRSWLRAGYTQGRAMIDDSAVRPNMFDNDNKMLMLGYEIEYSDLMVGFTFGLATQDVRKVSANENPNFSGRYESADTVFNAGARVTWRLR